MLGLISMQVELGVVMSELLEDVGTYYKIHMCAYAHGNPIDFEITGVKFTIPKLHTTVRYSSTS